MDLNYIINKYRMAEQIGDDVLVGNQRLNRLFGLNELIKENLNSESVVCELGSHIGSSGSLFAYYCKRVYCIDIWKFTEFEIIFDIIVANVFKNITKIRMDSVEASSLFPDYSLDLVYIDAAHDYRGVCNDINSWISKVKSGGYISGHDFSEEESNEVKKAVIDIIGFPDKIYEDSSWIKRI